MSALQILDERLHADPSRVVLRRFHLAWQARNTPHGRARDLVRKIAGLSEDQVAAEYGRVRRDFVARHWQTERIFEERFAEIEKTLDGSVAEFSETRRRLTGAYFCHEYTYAAAALMNPSIVPHPDQGGSADGEVRFVLSLRAVGEGHISSIAFREGVARPDGSFRLYPQHPIAMSAEPENGCGEEEEEAGECVTVVRHPDSDLSNTVIFPATDRQAGGLEDLRLVQLDHGGGEHEWIGTYTAYSGSGIRSELLRTEDFCRFRLQPIAGRAGRNKGMALFPRRIGGAYAMIGRQDGKNLYLLRSDRLDRWDSEGKLLMEPEYPWEFIQIGNCGSPIPTEQGWLLITHGVGAMRKYSLGAALLDLDDPSKLIARTAEPLLTAVDADRSGYVPNVVYSCGALKVGERLLLPYGISDSAVGFATVEIGALLDMMVRPERQGA